MYSGSVVQRGMYANLFEAFLGCRRGVRRLGGRWNLSLEQLGLLAWSGIGWVMARGVVRTILGC